MKVCSSCQRCYDDSAFSCIVEGHPILSETLAGSSDMIAGYRLEFLSESGGKFTTYRARHTTSGQPCFIRIITANGNDSNAFLREAQIASALFHPNVVGVYEAGTVDGVGLYIVTEDAGGQTLREYLTGSGVPPLLTSIQIVEQAAAALDAIHHSGLVHRSVKPENIVLTTDHDQQLLVRVQNPDLGGVIGRSILSDKFLIETAIASLRYFAPEQFSGETLSAQSDVYSLGVVFYEMLAGVPPFDSATAAGVIHKHRSEPPPDIRIDNFELRMLVTHSLMESLQKLPHTRTASAMAFARQMRHMEQLATHSSTPPPAGTVPVPAPVQQFAATVAAAPLPKPVQPLPARPAATAFKSAMDEDLDTPAMTEPIEIIPAVPVKLESEPTTDLVVEMYPAAADEIEYQAAGAMEELEPENEPNEIDYQPDIHFPTEHGMFADFEDFVAEPTAAAEVEAQPATTLETAGEPVHEISLVISIPDLPEPSETVDPLSEEPPAENRAEEAAEPMPHRSRLKHLRRKLHTMTASVSNEVPEIGFVPEPDPPAVTFYQDEIDAVPVAAVQTEPEKIDISPVQITPKAIEWDLPEDDIPSIEEVLEVRMREQIFVEPAVIQPLENFEPQKLVIEEPPIAEEEIWPDDTAAAIAADELEFFPAVVRQAEADRSAKLVREDSLFASYDAPSSRSPVGSRSLMIGGGVVAAMVFLFAGDVVINDYVRSPNTSESAAVTIPVQKSLPPTAQTRDVATAEQKPLKNFKAPADATEADRTKLVQPDAKTTLPAQKPPAPAAKEETESEPPIVVGARRNGGKTPVRSTLVISPGNGKIRTKVENDKAPAENKSSSSPNKPTGGTRPRIVVNQGP